MQPVAADRVVVTAARAAVWDMPTMARALPGLKPYHPNHRMKTPNRAREAEWPGISRA